TKLRDYTRKNEPSEKEKIQLWQQTTPQKIIVDEVTIGARLQFFGTDYDDMASWVKMSDGENNYRNACYWIEPGDGSKGALWRSDNPLLGTYNVYVWYGKLPQRHSASNVHFTVITRQDSRTFDVDQNKNVGKWNLLGKFEDIFYVKVTNNANGPVIIDAVKFEQFK
ncbi:unnamed protein product, partial [marine sediment metagenome]